MDTDFERAFTALVDGGVEFVIVGGLAATVHGSARLTHDLDVVYTRSRENLERPKDLDVIAELESLRDLRSRE